MPVERESLTHKFCIGGHERYRTAGLYDHGTVGELFISDVGNEGSTLRGVFSAWATNSAPRASGARGSPRTGVARARERDPGADHDSHSSSLAQLMIGAGAPAAPPAECARLGSARRTPALMRHSDPAIWATTGRAGDCCKSPKSAARRRAVASLSRCNFAAAQIPVPVSLGGVHLLGDGVVVFLVVS
jgi:hypothetical protein